MPIRVRIERVGYYEKFPDKVIYDLTIERTDETECIGNLILRKYTFNNGTQHVWHGTGQGIEALVNTVLEEAGNVDVK